MNTKPTVVIPSDTVEQAAKAMAESDCGALPVVNDADGRRVVGIITDRDIALRGMGMGKGPATLVSELMSQQVVSCAPESDLAEVERVMSDRQVRRVVIVDGDQCCVGIVAQADIARRAQRDEVGKVVERISQPKS